MQETKNYLPPENTNFFFVYNQLQYIWYNGKAYGKWIHKPDAWEFIDTDYEELSGLPPERLLTDPYLFLPDLIADILTES